jgi:UDP-3-O-[3-hydroxymyristoyl] glucosamine N-acyltransferase
MPDPRFFDNLGPVPLAEVAALAGAEAPAGDAGARPIRTAAPLGLAGSDAVAFFSDRRYAASLPETGAAACFITPDYADRLPETCAALITAEPQAAWARAAGRLHHPIRHAPEEGRIHPSAVIADDVVIHHGVVIGPGVEIGAGSVISANCVIGPGVKLGRDVLLRPNVTIGYALVGDRVRISAGAVIGEAGFGVAGSRTGAIDIPQLGRVLIADDVSIGACACIDRGAWEDTEIGAGCKIDNQVQIGHNCRLGRSVVLAGHVGLSGSVIVGDGVQMGGSAGIADHLNIGAGAMVAARAGVMHDIPAGEAWAGAPAKPVRKFMRESAWLAKMAAAPRDRT